MNREKISTYFFNMLTLSKIRPIENYPNNLTSVRLIFLLLPRNNLWINDSLLREMPTFAA